MPGSYASKRKQRETIEGIVERVLERRLAETGCLCRCPCRTAASDETVLDILTNASGELQKSTEEMLIRRYRDSGSWPGQPRPQEPQ